MAKARLKSYTVILKNGCDYTVKAESKSDAIKRVKQGRGKLVGRYECSPATRAMAIPQDSK